MSKKPRRKGHCMFCGRFGYLHKEDAIPKWIGRAFNAHKRPNQGWVQNRRRVLGDTFQTHRPRVVGGPTATKVPEVCQLNCNGGWMGRLEEEVKPFLLPMMFGEETILNEAEQTTLAVWLTKTALVFDVSEGIDRILGPDTCLWFGEQQKPIPGSRAWLSAYSGKTLGKVFHGLAGFSSSGHVYPPTNIEGLELSLVLGFVALKITIPRMSERPAQFSTPQPWVHAATLWPIEGTQKWPTETVLNDETFPAFAAMPKGQWKTGEMPQAWRRRQQRGR